MVQDSYNTDSQFIAASDKSGLPDFESVGGGAVPSAATISTCKTCGKAVIPPKQFCCKSCASKYNLAKARQSAKLKEHLQDNSWRGCNRSSQTCPECGKVFESKRQLRKHRIEDHNLPTYQKGFAWRVGDRKIAAQKKQRNTLKARYANGELTASFKGKHHSKEMREQLSKIRTQYLLNNETSGRRPDVKWYKVSNIKGEEFSQQGTWERDFAIALNHRGVWWIKRKTISYTSFDGVHKTYIPDFYLPDLGVYIEIKGLFNNQDRQKMNDVVKSNPDKRIYFIHGRKTLNQVMEGTLPLNDSLLYKESAYNKFK